ncbi:MAG: DUF6178 family protein [Desulfobacterales bacterium]
MRNFRLAEKGFLPFHEAVGVFQPMRVAQLKKEKILQKSPTSGHLGARADESYGPALKTACSPRLFLKLTTSMCFSSSTWSLPGLQSMTAAEQKPVRGREALKATSLKKPVHTSIGLESLLDSSKTSPDRREEHAAAGVTAHPLIDLFRTGYGHIAALRGRPKPGAQTTGQHQKTICP